MDEEKTPVLDQEGLELLLKLIVTQLGCITARCLPRDNVPNIIQRAADYTDMKIAQLVGASPDTLNTLEELADAIRSDGDVLAAMNTAITDKVDKEELLAHTSKVNNPHAVTASQLGLGKVENKTVSEILANLTSGMITDALGYTPARDTDVPEIIFPLSVANGGTGKNEGSAGLYNLMRLASGMGPSMFADEDYIPVGDVDANTVKKVTLGDLMTYFESSGSTAKIVTGSYTGIGTSTSEDDPCSIVFTLNPKILIIMGNTEDQDCIDTLVAMPALNVALWIGSDGNTGVVKCKYNNFTFSWWDTRVTQGMNSLSKEYSYVAIG